MFIHVQDPPQLQHWQIPTATHLGPTSTIFASIPTQANLRTYQPTQQLPPLLVSPLTPPSPLSIYAGGHHIFLTIIPIGKYMHTPPYTPSLYLHVDLQQCHLGKFLYNILLD